MPRSHEASLDKRGDTIQEMFAGVAPRYDLLNHLLSGGLDIWWRRIAAGALPESQRDRVLDLCSGTGDQALSLHRRGAHVTASDFCLPMVARAARKYAERGPGRPLGIAGDALGLPFRDGGFSAVTVSFGIRNVADLDAALVEIARVMEPGASLLVLEFAMPLLRPLNALYRFYFKRILPSVGKVLSPRGSAYDYLPDSVLSFPQRRDFLDRVEAAGFEAGGWRDLSGGIVCLYRATRRAIDPRDAAEGGHP